MNRVLYYDTLGKDYTDGIIVETLTDLKDFWSKCFNKNFRIIYRPADPQADFEAVCKLVYNCREMWFVVEECDLFFKAGDTNTEFKNLIQRGRKEEVNLVCVTQRPKGFGRLLTSQTEQFFVFRCKEPTDVEYYRDRFGADVAGQLPDLEQFSYLYYDERTNTTETRKEPWTD